MQSTLIYRKIVEVKWYTGRIAESNNGSYTDTVKTFVHYVFKITYLQKSCTII